MKNLRLVIYSFAVTIVFAAGVLCFNPIYAQDNTESDTVPSVDTDTSETGTEEETVDEDSVADYFNIETHVGIQSIFSKKVPVYVYVEPKISSSRAEVVWDIPRGLSIESDTEVWFEMVEGEGRTFQIDVLPSASGKYKIGYEVVAIRYDTNFVGSGTVELEFDDQLRSVPISSEYTRNLMLYNIARVLIGLAVLAGLYFGGKLLIKNIKKWIPKKTVPNQ